MKRKWGHTTPNIVTQCHGGGHDWDFVKGPKLKPLDIKGARTSQMSKEHVANGLLFGFVTGGGKATPPHAHKGGGAHVYNEARNWHMRHSAVGLHRRVVFRWGRKLGRMTGPQRVLWGAFRFVVNNGYWPDWDPEQRHPTGQDIANGADWANIPDWRWGVTDNYPPG